MDNEIIRKGCERLRVCVSSARLNSIQVVWSRHQNLHHRFSEHRFLLLLAIILVYWNASV